MRKTAGLGPSDVGRGGGELKNVITFERTMTKKVVTLLGKNMVTPTVDAPGDTNASDANGSNTC